MQATTTLPAQTAQRERATASIAPSTAAWLRLAVVYLLASVVLGIGMGAREDFTLRSLHTHLALLGWATPALAGLIYHLFPDARAGRLAVAHFWLYQLALPPMLIALGALLLGHPGAIPVLAVSQSVVALGLLAFVANVLLFVRMK